MKTTVQFSKRELATVLAALRFHQTVIADRRELLQPKSIDRLCERINTSEPLRIVVEVSGGVVDPVHVSHEACVTVYDHDNIEAGDTPPIDLEKTTDQLLFVY